MKTEKELKELKQNYEIMVRTLQGMALDNDGWYVVVSKEGKYIYLGKDDAALDESGFGLNVPANFERVTMLPSPKSVIETVRLPDFIKSIQIVPAKEFFIAKAELVKKEIDCLNGRINGNGKAYQIYVESYFGNKMEVEYESNAYLDYIDAYYEAGRKSLKWRERYIEKFGFVDSPQNGYDCWYQSFNAGEYFFRVGIEELEIKY